MLPRDCPGLTQSALGHGIPLKDMNSHPPKVKAVVSKLGAWLKRKVWEQCECVLGLRFFFFPCSICGFSGGSQG